jgi:hypothetical protein
MPIAPQADHFGPITEIAWIITHHTPCQCFLNCLESSIHQCNSPPGVYLDQSNPFSSIALGNQGVEAGEEGGGRD